MNFQVAHQIYISTSHVLQYQDSSPSFWACLQPPHLSIISPPISLSLILISLFHIHQLWPSVRSLWSLRSVSCCLTFDLSRASHALRIRWQASIKIRLLPGLLPWNGCNEQRSPEMQVSYSTLHILLLHCDHSHVTVFICCAGGGLLFFLPSVTCTTADLIHTSPLSLSFFVCLSFQLEAWRVMTGINKNEKKMKRARNEWCLVKPFYNQNKQTLEGNINQAQQLHTETEKQDFFFRIFLLCACI